MTLGRIGRFLAGIAGKREDQPVGSAPETASVAPAEPDSEKLRTEYEDRLYMWGSPATRLNYYDFLVAPLSLRATESSSRRAIDFSRSTLCFELEGESRYGFNILPKGTVLQQLVVIEARNGAKLLPGRKLKEAYLGLHEEATERALHNLVEFHQELLLSKGHALLIDDEVEEALPELLRIYNWYRSYRVEDANQENASELQAYLDDLHSLNQELLAAESDPQVARAIELFDELGTPVGFRFCVSFPVIIGATALFDRFLDWLDMEGVVHRGDQPDIQGDRRPPHVAKRHGLYSMLYATKVPKTRYCPK